MLYQQVSRKTLRDFSLTACFSIVSLNRLIVFSIAIFFIISNHSGLTGSEDHRKNLKAHASNLSGASNRWGSRSGSVFFTYVLDISLDAAVLSEVNTMDNNTPTSLPLRA